jgi:hypothetical protein
LGRRARHLEPAGQSTRLSTGLVDVVSVASSITLADGTFPPMSKRLASAAKSEISPTACLPVAAAMNTMGSSTGV